MRFPLVAHLQTFPGIAPLQDALRATFPYMEARNVQELAFAFGPGGPAASAPSQQTTWELTSDSGRLLVIGPGSATLSAGREYAGVEEFAECFSEVLSALAEIEGLRRCERVGVRYLSLAESLPGSEEWRSWFKPDIVGWIGSNVLGPKTELASSMTQTTLAARPSGSLASLPADVQAIIRHGFVPSGTQVPGIPEQHVEIDSFLLDLDLFVVHRQMFDASALHEQFLALHGQIDRFFRWTLTDVGASHFELKEG